MLFYRFISENLTSYLNEAERRAGTADFDYARLSDADAERGRASTVEERASTPCPPSCSPTSGSRPATTPT